MATLPFAERAGRWFLESGIQEPAGGVARYYRADTGQSLPVSTEITAYAASTLIYLHSLTGNQAYLDRALLAAGFLARTAWDRERRIIPFECNGHRPLAYFFDCGIIVRGLLSVWRVTGREEFLEVARNCGHSMARDFSDGKGGFHPILSLPDKLVSAHGERWSQAPGCYQLKAALGWSELAGATGDPGFRQSYEHVLASALETHGEFLPGAVNPYLVMDRLHAYCYFLEGLLPVASLDRCSQAIREGIPRVARYLREIGPAFARSDVYAQLLRMRCFAAWTGVLAMDEAAASAEAGELCRFQMEHPDVRVSGGFVFGQKSGQHLPHVNPVSAGFALQALAWWQEFRSSGELPPLHSLI